MRAGLGPTHVGQSLTQEAVATLLVQEKKLFRINLEAKKFFHKL